MVRVPLANIQVSEEMMNLVAANKVNTGDASIRNWYELALKVFVDFLEERSRLEECRKNKFP